MPVDTPPPYPLQKAENVLDVRRVRRLADEVNLRVTAHAVSTKGTVLKLKLKRLKVPGAPQVVVIQAPWNESAELNSVTDYFSEQCRIHCKFMGLPTPAEFWMSNYRSLMQMQKRMSQRMSEVMYRSVRMCNNFRVSVAITILRMFGAKRWLDISAGWGDRLLAALLTESVEFYCGVDPNPCLAPAYAAMIDAFAPKEDRGKYIIVRAGFEVAQLPQGVAYDLVFSSPPFFDLERYSADPMDSMEAHGTTEATWLQGFLLPSIAKANAHLAHGGHMVLYLGESKGTRYIRIVKSFVTDLGLVDIGSIYYQDGRSVREFLVWLKPQKYAPRASTSLRRKLTS